MQNVDYVILGAVALILVFGSLFFLNGPSEYTLKNAYDDGCRELKIKYSCDQYAITRITTLTTGGFAYTLGNVCATKGYDNTLACARSCGCNVNGTGISVTGTPRKVYSDNPVIDGVVGDPYAEEEQQETGDEYYGV